MPIPSRESGNPYPVSDKIDPETGLPIQPQDPKPTEKNKENTRKMIVLAFLSE